MDEILVIKNVSKRYGNQKVLDNVNLEIKKGEIFALLGPNGAGKTTLIRIIAEGIKHEGEVIFNGQDIGKTRYKIGYAPQEGLFYDALTSYDNLKFYAHLHRKPVKRAKEMLKRFGIPNKKVKHLSGGMKRRLNIAIALIGDPEILILDEPTVGLDVQSRRELWDIIRALKSEGKAILLTTHYMEEAETLADRVAIINEGRIIAVDTVAGLKKKSGIKSAIEIRGEFKTVPEGFVSENGAIIYYTENPREEMVGIVSEATKYGKIKEIIVREPTLDDVFLKLTGRRLEE